MPEYKPKLDDYFLRQRRNLIVTSILLFFYNLLDAKIKTIGLLGTSVELSSPENVENIIVLFLVYFLIRFYQYYPKGIIISGIRSDIEKYADDNFTAIYENIQRKNGKNGYCLVEPRSFLVERKGAFNWRFNLEGAYTVITDDNKTSAGKIKDDIWISYKEIKFPILLTCMNYIIRKPHITEYFLPYLLCLVSLWVSVLDWQ